MAVNFNEEKFLWKQGYELVAGLDEAGRGPLAGPVVAAAVIIRPGVKYRMGKINDSKKLSEKQREFFYEKLTSHSEIIWGVGIVSEKIIDKINILEATKLAMIKSLEEITSKIDGRQFLKNSVFLILDGNFTLNFKRSRFCESFSEPKQKSIIGADGKVFSCAAAGIIAKVTRDKIMQKYHKKYPGYSFDKHKGYGTKLHLKQLEELGPSKIHRRSFYPMTDIAKN